jgi:hypothetical protein
MAIRDDYILRHLALLRQAIAQMVKFRTTGRPLAALDAAQQAQEKLFARTTAELSALSLDELIRLLRVDEPPATADEKVRVYASLLHETGLVYAAMDRPDSALSCFQLALHVLLTTVAEPTACGDEVRTTLRDLLARIPPEQLHAPALELMQQLGAPDR